MSQAGFDPERIFEILNGHGVRYVVIGGFAGSFRGTPVVTYDLDICHSRDKDNLERMAAALSAMNAELRVAGDAGDVAFPLDARSLALGDSFTLRTDFGPLDILGTPSGTAGFADLDAGASDFELALGLIVRVASVDDLLRMKRASHRPKDVSHLAHLEALREEIEGFRRRGLDPQQGS